VSATSTSGLAVTLAAASGPCTVDNPTSTANVHINGTGMCTVTASQAGNTNYLAASDVSRTFSISRANQSITFNALANAIYGDPDVGLSATASSGLAVSFAATGNCTLSGSTVHIVSAGSCTITASRRGAPTSTRLPT
jgi:hypothetical protein